MPKWWKVVKVAVKVAMKVGRVKEKARVDEFIEGIDTVIKEAEKPKG